MKRILLSIMTIAVVAIAATSATGAYFSSQAKIVDNTFSTGILQIRVNGQATLAGASFTAMAPGKEITSPEYHINNYGQPWFAGPSNLTAKRLQLSVNNPDDQGVGLWSKVYIKVEVNRGWPTWQEAYNGKIENLKNQDLLAPRWSELAPGDSEMLRYTIWLPENDADQNWLMGKTMTWDFVVEGRTK